MNLSQLTAEFQKLVAPDIPNEWDVEEHVERFLDVDDGLVQEIFQLVPVIWPVSHSLCYSYLAEVQNGLQCLRSDQLFEWVGATLDQYEQGGLRQAQRFMAEVETLHLCRLRGEAGLEFTHVAGRLLPYARGLAGTSIDLVADRSVYTDTETIFLPHKLEECRGEEDNFLLFRLIIAYQHGYIACGSYTVTPNAVTADIDNNDLQALERFFASFAQPGRVGKLYHLLETLRVTAYLQHELPGLMRDTREIRRHIHQKTGKTSLTGRLQNAICLGMPPDAITGPPDLARFYELARCNEASAADSLTLCSKLYADLEEDLEQSEALPLVFQGEMRLPAVAAARRKQRQIDKNLFIESLANLLMTLPPGERSAMEEQLLPEANQQGASPENDGVTMLPQQQEPGWEAPETSLFVTLDNSSLEGNDDIKHLADKIIADVGRLPQHYIASAFGMAGQATPDFVGPEDNPDEQEEVSGPITYDEWDYRRSGFRKNWCVLVERELASVRSSFLQNTLASYSGEIMKLRRQFEMMRTRERFIRRQRDGDDIDLDAMVESLADSQAGLAPSDRLFVRLQRDERDIAALFLVDMSNSTEGWVSTTIKEAIILLCEAMEIVGDRYAIYGFSGMRRLRCEVFHVKHFDEKYGGRVQERICSIGPREYTRMGPAIRHSNKILGDIDARVRLLVILSDGKPEDYDDYKGEYAIEDTRHALIESRVAGIHPFCITVDKHDHDYLAHMYGKNYIFINDIKKLPARMPEIYRVLTT